MRLMIAGLVWLTNDRNAGIAAALALSPYTRNPLLRILGTPFSRRTVFESIAKGKTPLGGSSNPYIGRPGKYAVRHPGQVIALAVMGKVISDQMIVDQGGDVGRGFGAAPSKHLVGGRPWWES